MKKLGICFLTFVFAVSITNSVAAKILYSSPDETGTRQLWVMNDDGSNKIQLTSGPYDKYGVWSPDGNQIALRVRTQNTWNGEKLYITSVQNLMDENDDNEILVASDIHGGVSWYPDGQSLVYVRLDGTCWNVLRRVNLDGSNDHLFLDPGIVGKGEVTTYDFSPDGTRIVFSAQNGCWSPTYDLYLVDADGKSNPSVFYSDYGPLDRRPVWSYDGDKIFWYHQPNWQSEVVIDLYSKNLDGTGLTQLTDSASEGVAYNPLDAIPDGKILYLFGVFREPRTLAVMDEYGNHVVTIAQNIVTADWTFGKINNKLDVNFDIKPGSCPNPVNVKSKGALPVAVLGTESFDVTQIDPESISLKGVSPIRLSLEDVATPFDGEIEDSWSCNTYGPDGNLDLTLKFDTQEVLEALGEVEDEDCLVLDLKGKLKDEYDGIELLGEDVIRILKKGK